MIFVQKHNHKAPNALNHIRQTSHLVLTLCSTIGTLEPGQFRTNKALDDGIAMNKKHNPIGSDFDDFLKEEGLYEDAKAIAVKRVIAYQIAAAMKRRRISKTILAQRMHTSRAAVQRLLDPEQESITLLTLNKAATAIGRKLKVELV